MTTIRAAQLIFSRVEIDYSFQRRSGYQTAYCSPSLAADEVALIERRVQCFKPSGSTDERLQCFPLPSGKIVVSRTVSIAPDAEITDRSLRPGAFIAHCLILSPVDFAAIDNNAFALFETFGFLDDPTLMVSDYIRASSVEEPARIDVPYHLSFDTSWPEDEALKILSLGLQAPDLAKGRRSVVIVGSATEIQEAVRTIIMRIDPARRVACSFDTCVDGCLIQPGMYWAIGLAQRQAGAGGDALIVDATARRVQGGTTSQISDDLYLSWLRHTSGRPDGRDLVRAHGPTVQQLATAFALRKRPRVEDLDPEGCASFATFHGKRVWAEVETALSGALGKSLTTSLVQYLQSHSERQNLAEILAGAAAQQFRPADLAELVVDWLLTERPELRESEWRTLAELGVSSTNNTLRFLAIVSQKKVDHRARQLLLEGLNDRAVHQLRNELGDFVPPALFISPSHAGMIIDSLPATIGDEDLLAITEAVIEANAASLLDRLTTRIGAAEVEAIHNLLKLTRKRSDVPASFRNALEELHNQMPRRRWPF